MPATTNPATTPMPKRILSGTKRVLKFSGRAVLCVVGVVVIGVVVLGYVLVHM